MDLKEGATPDLKTTWLIVPDGERISFTRMSTGVKTSACYGPGTCDMTEEYQTSADLVGACLVEKRLYIFSLTQTVLSWGADSAGSPFGRA